jgi:hypothetical protein
MRNFFSSHPFDEVERTNREFSMRKTILLLVFILAVAPMAAAGSRTLTSAVDANGVSNLDFESGIGDVKITAVQGSDEVLIEVVLNPRRGGIFSSMRKAERDVAAASLKIETDGDTLMVGIDPPADDERRFEEQWTIQIPARLAVEIDHGVGDVEITGMSSALELDSGVGDVAVRQRAGSIALDLGVGTAVVRAPAAEIKSADAASGVGDARITVKGETIEGGGFISHAASWQGDGSSMIEVSVGVGDAIIKLE